jgi:cobalt-zinc-cadmium efflux system protein
LALFGDSAHLATDLFSLAMSLAAVTLAVRPTSAWRSFGFYRLEVLASFLNGILLFLVALVLAKESVTRLGTPEPVKVKPLILIAFLGLLFNLVSAWILHRASGGHHDLVHGHDHHHHHPHDHGHLHAAPPSDRNMESALLHVWSDALGSGAVIVGGLVMAFTAYYWVDAVIGLALSLWILRWSWRVILDSAHVLLESTPKHIETEKVISELRLLDDRIQSVDDLHVWEITSRMYSATAEVQVFEMDLQEADRLRLKMHDILYEKFGIAHVVLAIRPK